MSLLAILAVAAGRCEYAGPALHVPVTSAIPAQAVVERQLPPEESAALSRAFDIALDRTKATALGVAIAPLGQGLWSRARLPEGYQRLFWASAGKSFTAVVVMQLVEEGRISLDDRLARWVPDAPNAETITIRDLLSHTSGLFSANEDIEWRKSPKPISSAEELAILKKHGPLFCPGKAWRYSNSGYAMLGHIISAVEGRSWQQSIRARIIDRLALKTTVVVDDVNQQSIVPPAATKDPQFDLQIPGPAGPVASDAADMVRFWAALLDGTLVKPATRDLMFANLYPMFDGGSFYGLGTMLFDLPDGQERLVLLGHAGGIPGIGAIMVYSPRDRALVAVALSGNAPAPAVVNLMLQTLRTTQSP